MDIIAIDCGASFLKGALFHAGKLTKHMQLQAPQVHTSLNVFQTEQISTLIALVEEMIFSLSKGLTEVKLCISNEMHGFILATESGTPYTDYISWQKEFGALKVNGCSALEVLKTQSNSRLIENTGMQLRSGLPSCNLLWLNMQNKLEYGEKLIFFTLGDYIIKRFSGVTPHCHSTNAAATGLFSLYENEWNWNLIKIVCENKIEFLPIGNKEVSFEKDGIIFHALPAIGDQQAALLGSGLISKTSLSFNLGTGAQVSRIIDQPVFGDYQVRPYFDNKYIKTIPHVPSGRAMNVYIRFVKDILKKFNCEVSDDIIWDKLLEEVKYDETNKEKSNVMVCDLSFFENSITDHIVGSITNISEYSLTINNIFDSVLTQMANNFVSVAAKINEDLPVVTDIIFSGGVSRKISSLRDKIMKSFPNNLPYTIAEDETLFGCYLYGKGDNR